MMMDDLEKVYFDSSYYRLTISILPQIPTTRTPLIGRRYVISIRRMLPILETVHTTFPESDNDSKLSPNCFGRRD